MYRNFTPHLSIESTSSNKSIPSYNRRNGSSSNPSFQGNGTRFSPTSLGAVPHRRPIHQGKHLGTDTRRQAHASRYRAAFLLRAGWPSARTGVRFFPTRRLCVCTAEGRRHRAE